MKIAVIGEEPEKQLNLWIKYMIKVDQIMNLRRFYIHDSKINLRGSGLICKDRPGDCWVELSPLLAMKEGWIDAFTSEIRGILKNGLLIEDEFSHLDLIANTPAQTKYFDVNFNR